MKSDATWKKNRFLFNLNSLNLIKKLKTVMFLGKDK